MFVIVTKLNLNIVLLLQQSLNVAGTEFYCRRYKKNNCCSNKISLVQPDFVTDTKYFSEGILVELRKFASCNTSSDEIFHRPRLLMASEIGSISSVPPISVPLDCIRKDVP